MTTKTKSPPSSTVGRVPVKVAAPLWNQSPWTTEDHLRCIEAIGQRITGYIQFMSKVATLSGTSSEAKEKAVLDFYEQLVLMEKQLARIQEEIQLG